MGEFRGILRESLKEVWVWRFIVCECGEWSRRGKCRKNPAQTLAGN